jgi:hypothetical protein
MTQPTLETVVNDLTRWRQTRAKRGPIPNELRQKISTLLPRYRISELTTTLGVNTAQLRTFSKTTTPRKTKKLSLEFVRIAPVQDNYTVKVQCQIKRTDGATMECVVESVHLNKLMEAFLC